jgi:UDP-glucose 4-epimerase
MVMPTFRKDIEFFHGSLLDPEALKMSMTEIDAVYHLGAVADVKDVFEDPHYSENINVRGTINALEASRKAKVSRFIYGSTTWVYSEVRENAINEDTPLSPPSHLYTATKIASEYYCRCYTQLYGLPTTILRYGIPYGPRARDGAVIPIFVRKALSGQPLTIAGDGLQFRKFVYVEDLAEGNVLALKHIGENKIFNLDGLEKVSIKQIAETIQKLIGNVRIEYIEGRPGDFSGKEISSERASRELNWEPKVSFEEGVRKYIAWYQHWENERRLDEERLDQALRQPSGTRTSGKAV